MFENKCYFGKKKIPKTIPPNKLGSHIQIINPFTKPLASNKLGSHIQIINPFTKPLASKTILGVLVTDFKIPLTEPKIQTVWSIFVFLNQNLSLSDFSLGFGFGLGLEKEMGWDQCSGYEVVVGLVVVGVDRWLGLLLAWVTVA